MEVMGFAGKSFCLVDGARAGHRIALGLPKRVRCEELTICSATAFDWVVAYPFKFRSTGWYMFVINQTWVEPTIVRFAFHTALLPIASSNAL